MVAAADALMVGHGLHSTTTRYTILKFIGEGCFGKVAKCCADNTNKIVAVKILKEDYYQDVEDELSVLKKISTLNADQYHLVNFYEQFDYLGYNCLVFELLDVNLYHLVRKMNVNFIRPIANQLMVALQGLESVQIMHTDIKPDNVMIVDIDKSPYSVKLIDFGIAHGISAAMPGIICQPTGYRAPEVSLGLPYSEAIDMWGVGCTLAFLYLNDNLFPVHCEYLMMKSIVEILGMPSNHQLHFGLYTKNFFTREVDEMGTRWRLLTPEEYSDENDEKVKKWPDYRPHWSSLDDLLHTSELEENETVEDRKAFISFLKELLNMDRDERISPIEALQHPYITGSYLSQEPAKHETKVQIVSTLQPEDSDAEYPLSRDDDKVEEIEPHSPEDWDIEYALDNGNVEEMEPHSPEDWDLEYVLDNGNVEKMEPHSPEDLDLEYALDNGKVEEMQPHSPEDWDLEYALAIGTF